MPEILRKNSRQSFQEKLLLSNSLSLICQGLRQTGLWWWWGSSRQWIWWVMGWGGRNQILGALKNCVLIITWQKGDDCYFNTFVSKTNPTNMWGRFFSNRLWSLRKTQSTKERRDTSQGTCSWGFLWCLCTFVWYLCTFVWCLCTFVWCLCLFLLSRMQKWGKH